MTDEKKYAKHLVRFGKMSHKLRNDEDRIIHTGKVKITVTLDDDKAHSFWTYNREHKDLTGTILVGPDDPQQTRLFELSRAAITGVFTAGAKSNAKELNETSLTLSFDFADGADIVDLLEAFDGASGFLLVESMAAKNTKRKDDESEDKPLVWYSTGLGRFNYPKPIAEKLLDNGIETVGDLQAWIREGDKLTDRQKKTVLVKMAAWFKNQGYKLPDEFNQKGNG